MFSVQRPQLKGVFLKYKQIYSAFFSFLRLDIDPAGFELRKMVTANKALVNTDREAVLTNIENL